MREIISRRDAGSAKKFLVNIMNIQDEFLSKHSKKQAEKVVKYVGADKARFKELMSCYLSSEMILAQRAAMSAGYCVVQHPQLFTTYLPKILKAMEKPVHDAIVRNGLLIMRRVEIPEKLESKVIELCFELMSSAESPIAIKVYAIAVIQKVSKKYPDLLQELKIRVNAQLPFESKAFAAHARKNLFNSK
ncbi:MAG: hypothetical protein KA492_14435 [Bacteroidia bacterium]|nr:hypothetical protein [Bacteroidia bacterium]